MTNFLELAIWLFELLVMTMLPIISVMMALIYIVKIGETSKETLGNWMRGHFKKLKN
jgi:hypothetical protein